MKSVNLQCVYEIDDAAYPWIAKNRDGTLCGFRHAPIRDYQAGNGEWIDSVNGSHGEIIPYAGWEGMVRRLSDVTDIRKAIRDGILKKQLRNTQEIRENKIRDTIKKRRNV